MEGTIVGMIPSVRGCHPPPRPSLRTIPLLGEMVNLLGTYGASRGSSTMYVVLRRCTYLVGAHALRARNLFLGTRVLVYHSLYVKYRRTYANVIILLELLLPHYGRYIFGPPG